MPKTNISNFGQATKITKYSDDFEVLHNCVLPCHLLNTTIFTQNKFIVIDLSGFLVSAII